MGGHVEVEVLQALQLGQVAVDDAAQGDLVDVDLLARDQVEQQVEGTLENRSADLVAHSRQATEGAGHGRVPCPAWRACSQASSPRVTSTWATTSAPCATGCSCRTSTTPSTRPSTRT